MEFILEMKAPEFSYFTWGTFLKGEIGKVVTKIITIEWKGRKKRKKMGEKNVNLVKALDFYFPILDIKCEAGQL